MSEELEQSAPQDKTATAASRGKKIDRSRTRSPRSASGVRRKKFTVRLSDEEELLLEQIAAMRGVSKSKALLDNALHDGSMRIDEGESLYGIAAETSKEELRWYRRQLHSIVTNMRQVACYATSKTMLPPDYDAVVSTLEEVISKIDQVLDEDKAEGE